MSKSEMRDRHILYIKHYRHSDNQLKHIELNGIGAVIKVFMVVTVVMVSSLWMRSNSRQKLQFFIVSFSKRLLLFFMCSDQHVKYQMSLLLEYQVKQNTLTVMSVLESTLHLPIVIDKAVGALLLVRVKETINSSKSKNFLSSAT